MSKKSLSISSENCIEVSNLISGLKLKYNKLQDNPDLISKKFLIEQFKLEYKKLKEKLDPFNLVERKTIAKLYGADFVSAPISKYELYLVEIKGEYRVADKNFNLLDIKSKKPIQIGNGYIVATVGHEHIFYDPLGEEVDRTDSEEVRVFGDYYVLSTGTSNAIFDHNHKLKFRHNGILRNISSGFSCVQGITFDLYYFKDINGNALKDNQGEIIYSSKETQYIEEHALVFTPHLTTMILNKNGVQIKKLSTHAFTNISEGKFVILERGDKRSRIETFKVYDLKGEEIGKLPDKPKYLEGFHEGWILNSVGNKAYGVKGEELSIKDHRFNGDFSCGRNLISDNKNGKNKIIDTQGNILEGKEFNIVHGKFIDGVIKVTDDLNNTFYIDTWGEKVF